jgi:hypothetical protein
MNEWMYVLTVEARFRTSYYSTDRATYQRFHEAKMPHLTCLWDGCLDSSCVLPEPCPT